MILKNKKEILKSLPDDILTYDVDRWRVPTSEEIKIVIGRDSLAGLSGASAAKLIGVTPSNFRKYTAKDGASTQQRISYAMWHLLLARIGIIGIN